MPTNPEGKRLQKLETEATEATSSIYLDPNNFKRVAPSALGAMDERFAGISSFLPSGMQSPYADSLKYQRAPGVMYTNYETKGPLVAGELKKPVPPEGKVPPPTQNRPPAGSYEQSYQKPKLFIGKGMKAIEVENQKADHQRELAAWNENKKRYYSGESLQTNNAPKFLDYIGKGMGRNKGAIEAASAKYRKDVQAFNEQQRMGSGGAGGAPKQKAMAAPSAPQAQRRPGIAGAVEDIDIGNITGMADGGIASIAPQHFQDGGFGGFAGALQVLGGNNADGSPTESSLASLVGGGGEKEMVSRSDAVNSANLSGKSTEELMQIIAQLQSQLEGGGEASGGIASLSLSGPTEVGATPGINSGVGGTVEDVSSGGSFGGVAGAAKSFLGMADGGDVYYPRMNGQIAGPGTERSDDIPAMLSDGEFVVNAKALRGIGKMDGANGDKEEQRQKGARMMYAMQQAGEQAMRNS